MEIITKNTTDTEEDIAYLADEDTVVMSDVGDIVDSLRSGVEMAAP